MNSLCSSKEGSVTASLSSLSTVDGPVYIVPSCESCQGPLTVMALVTLPRQEALIIIEPIRLGQLVALLQTGRKLNVLPCDYDAGHRWGRVVASKVSPATTQFILLAL